MVTPHATPLSSNGRPANRLLRQLPDEDFARISGSLTTVSIKSKRPLYGRGEPITEVIFMNGGVASVTVAMSDGMLVEVGTIGDEGVVGLDAVFGGGLSHAECMVQIPGPDALAMPLSVVKAELARQGPLCESLHRYSAGLFALIMQSAACMALHDVPARCARWLLLAHDRTHTDAFELSHEFLAMMLGARRPTVTIAAGALQHAGFIRYHHGRITILDRAGLKARRASATRKSGTSSKPWGSEPILAETYVGQDRKQGRRSLLRRRRPQPAGPPIRYAPSRSR